MVRRRRGTALAFLALVDALIGILRPAIERPPTRYQSPHLTKVGPIKNQGRCACDRFNVHAARRERVRFDRDGEAPDIGEGFQMTTTTGASEGRDEKVRVPFMQRVLDDPFLLLFLGVVIPTVLYTMWAVMEVASIPLAK